MSLYTTLILVSVYFEPITAKSSQDKIVAFYFN